MPDINRAVCEAVTVAGHVIERTSPKGEAFKGRCMNCGASSLTSKDALLPCPGLQRVSLAEFITGVPE